MNIVWSRSVMIMIMIMMIIIIADRVSRLQSRQVLLERDER